MKMLLPSRPSCPSCIAALAAAAATSVLLAAPALAADVAAASPSPSVSESGSRAAGLSRAQVRASLIDAQRDGLVPTGNGDYPPAASTIARNRELYAISHRRDGAGGAGRAAPKR